MSRSKYNAKKVVNEYGRFDSKLEAARYIVLNELQRNGFISDLKRQVPFELVPKQKLREPKTKVSKKTHKVRTLQSEQAVTYYADFTYYRNGELVVEDTKGVETPEYKIKRKLMLHKYGIQITEVNMT